MISLGISHESVSQRAIVSDRGAGFGDVDLFKADGTYEFRFCWTGNGHVWAHGSAIPTQAQKTRAVRALAETEIGRKMFKLPQDFDTSTYPDAAAAELEELRDAAVKAGLIPATPAPAADPDPEPIFEAPAAEPTTDPAAALPVSTTVTVDGVTLEIIVKR